ncbi:hypothetical protein FAGKG844_40091 [Frankia sp. AgKG'84/4]
MTASTEAHQPRIVRSGRPGGGYDTDR